MHPWILAQVPAPTTAAGPVIAPPATGVVEAPAHGVAATAGTMVASTNASQPSPDAPPKDQGPNWILFVLPLGLVAIYLMSRGKGKEEKKRKAQLDSMKKGDEVETIGGLVGKIVDVKDNKVVIKIDESANVKATYLKAAISRVITQEDKDKADDKK